MKAKHKAIQSRLPTLLGIILGFCLSNFINNIYIYRGEYELEKEHPHINVVKKEEQSRADSILTAGNDDSIFESRSVNADEDVQKGCTGMPTQQPVEEHALTGICSMIGPSASALHIWNQHLDEIFNASQHSDDEKFIWHDFTAKLLYFVTPRLQNSVQNLPKDWDKIGNILEIIFERMQYLREKEKNNEEHKGKEPRPLRILIMGGSVSYGRNCATQPKGNGMTKVSPKCAWPGRLEVLLNNFLGKGSIEVHLNVIGGTNTIIGSKAIEYAISSPKLQQPDIIIHSYATNDMHVLTELEAKKRNVTLEAAIMDINQEFIRQILGNSKRCKDRKLPLLLYYDDYIGNEQKELLRTNAFSTAIKTLSSFYGLGFMSYVETVKHTVYGDTTEDWLSPDGWPNRNVHPGRGFHIISPWIIGFNLLNMAATYCTLNASGIPLSSSILEYSSVSGLPLLNNELNLPRPPQSELKGLPPKLDMNLTLDNISERWMADDNERTEFDKAACPANDLMDDPCIFAWMAGIGKGFVRKGSVIDYLHRKISFNDGWEVNDKHRKLGFAATKRNATFELEFKKIGKSVKVLNIVSMQSYGEKWKDSEIQMEAFIDKNGLNSVVPAGSVNILGYHDKETSESYYHKLVLEGEGAMPRETLRVRIKLSGGTAFKITGMAFCDH